MKDSFQNELIEGDVVAFVFGAGTNTLRQGIVTGSVSLGKTSMLVIVESSPDGTPTTFKVYPAQVCRLVRG